MTDKVNIENPVAQTSPSPHFHELNHGIHQESKEGDQTHDHSRSHEHLDHENSVCTGESCSCSQELNLEEFSWKKEFKPIFIAIVISIIAAIIENLSGTQVGFRVLRYLGIILFIIAYIIAGEEVIKSVFSNLRKFQLFDENFLMFIATIGAFFTGNFAEAIAVIIFYEVGENLEKFSVARSKKSIRALLENKPEIVHVKNENGFYDLPPEKICIGETIIIKPGEKVPLDGVLSIGHSSFDTSVLTGESKPRDILQGEQVLSGMVNLQNSVEILVQKRYENSTIARILELVQNSEENKSPTERFITKFAKFYTPIIVISAIFLAILPPLIGNEEFSVWFYRALIFLVISCPCALVLSIPLTYFGGIGGASKNGILIKGSNHLEALSQLKTLVLDKTGTITKGNFKVSEIITFNEMSPETLLEIVAHAESHSNHPIASSILEAAKFSGMKYKIEDFSEIPAHGIFVKVDGKEIIAGSDKILHRYNVPHELHFCDMEGTIVHVAIDRNYTGYLVVSDEIKPDSAEAIKSLNRMGLKDIVMLSGDEKCIVELMAEQLKIPKYQANLLPEDKVNYVLGSRKEKEILAFVGDGINDAPVIANADIGIAMGAMGSDAAIESADIVLMTDSLMKVAEAILIAQKTRKIIWQNIIMIFIVKILFLILGAAGMMNMWGAVFADVGMALIAILNARRILNYSPLQQLAEKQI